MARIPAEELERPKAEISVERLVESSGVELKAAGKDLLGRCPFHEHREASLVLTPGKNLWHCFSCQIDFEDLSDLADDIGGKANDIVLVVGDDRLADLQALGQLLLGHPLVFA